ncbi:MAG: hypothetical protein NZ578_03955 [Candidatus Binatia bacterium]|nr:hypothetical protein [Candidatus Binatia bacterium]
MQISPQFVTWTSVVTLAATLTFSVGCATRQRAQRPDTWTAAAQQAEAAASRAEAAAERAEAAATRVETTATRVEAAAERAEQAAARMETVVGRRLMK